MVSPCSLLRNPALLIPALAMAWLNGTHVLRCPWHPEKDPPELCWALRTLLEPGRQWGEPAEELACFPLSNPHWVTFHLPGWGFLDPEPERCVPTAARGPGTGKGTRSLPSHTGAESLPGLAAATRAPQPRTGLGKGHRTQQEPWARASSPWEEGSPPAMAGEGLVPACTPHRRLVEREASLKVTCFFPLFFNELLS